MCAMSVKREKNSGKAPRIRIRSCVANGRERTDGSRRMTLELFSQQDVMN
jgi:hypothetical protein